MVSCLGRAHARRLLRRACSCGKNSLRAFYFSLGDLRWFTSAIGKENDEVPMCQSAQFKFVCLYVLSPNGLWEAEIA